MPQGTVGTAAQCACRQDALCTLHDANVLISAYLTCRHGRMLRYLVIDVGPFPSVLIREGNIEQEVVSAVGVVTQGSRPLCQYDYGFTMGHSVSFRLFAPCLFAHKPQRWRHLDPRAGRSMIRAKVEKHRSAVAYSSTPSPSPHYSVRLFP